MRAWCVCIGTKQVWETSLVFVVAVALSRTEWVGDEGRLHEVTKPGKELAVTWYRAKLAAKRVKIT